ncbi:WG repeat-containing protein [Reichenbachiella sp. 5M10]|uniref:WG repeat-containing protein n=1 Tax=Reichenbachiella sp. 5M10 TaxID=1889772 RepID=UPI00117BCEA8|nr:WG repeat-containing protein [Reichenbachiella sp. 5M10]
MGLKNKSGKILITPRYDKLGWSDGSDLSTDDVIGYQQGQLWGLVSLSNKRVTAAKYYSLRAVHRGLIIASLKGRFSNLLFYGTINSKGQTIIDFQNQSLEVDHDLLILSEKRNNQRYYGLYNQSNQELLPKQYHHIQHLHRDLFSYTDTLGYTGVIHRNGSIKLPPELDSLSLLNEEYIKTYRTGKEGLLDAQGQVILPPLYKTIIDKYNYVPFAQYEIKDTTDQVLNTWSADSIQWIGDRFIAIYTNGWMDVKNSQNETIYEGRQPLRVRAFKEHLILQRPNRSDIISPSEHSFSQMSFDSIKVDTHYLFGYSDHAWNIYNNFGRQLNEKSIEDILPESNNLIPVQRNGYWGYLDHRGNTAITYKYDEVTPFVGQIARVKYLGYQQLINQFGEVVGEASYDSIWVKNNNTAVTRSRSRTDILNNNGAALFQTYNTLAPHTMGYLEVTENNKIGLVNHRGKTLFHPEYDYISDLIQDKFIILKRGNEIAVSYKDGSYLIPFTSRFEDILDISEGMLSIQKNGKYGFINFDQELHIAHRYDSVGVFSGQLAPVKLNGHWGFVSPKEELLIQPNLDSVSHFSNHMSIVKREDHYGIYNDQGELKVAIEYDAIRRTSHQLFVVKQAQKYGLFDAGGQKILGPSYDRIAETHNGLFIVRRRGKEGLMNERGMYVIPLKYKQIAELSPGRFLCQVILE